MWSVDVDWRESGSLYQQCKCDGEILLTSVSGSALESKIP